MAQKVFFNLITKYERKEALRLWRKLFFIIYENGQQDAGM
jgi:hypothetical protein